ncbi:MAG: SCO family protein [Beijerinckiaceae bacterium]
MDPRRKFRMLASTLLGLLIIGIGGTLYLSGMLNPLIDPQNSGTINGIGGPVQLTDHNGGRINTGTLGKPHAVFFGFTHCPDVCPTTMQAMTATLTELGDAAKDFRVYFVSVDPERDTQPLLKQYLSSFDPRMIGLTGTREETDKVIRAYRVFARKVPLEKGSYTMDHTAAVYLMDSKNQLVGTIADNDDDKTRVQKVRRLLGR